MEGKSPRDRKASQAGASRQLDAILERLDFTPETVIEEACRQASLFAREVADYRIRCMRERSAAEAAYDETRAACGLNLRAQAREAGEKLTEENLKQVLECHETVRAARQRMSAAEESDEYSKLVLEAWRQRRDMIESVGRLAGTEIAMQRFQEMAADRMSDARRRLQSKYGKG